MVPGGFSRMFEDAGTYVIRKDLEWRKSVCLREIAGAAFGWSRRVALLLSVFSKHSKLNQMWNLVSKKEYLTDPPGYGWLSKLIT